MAVCFLTIKNPTTQFEKTYALENGETKIGKYSWFKYDLSSEDTKIPKDESTTIIVENGGEVLNIKYNLKSILQKKISVKFNEIWKWVDCQMVITKNNPEN